jgi:hypothetical protein
MFCTVKVKLYLCSINLALCHENTRGSGGMAPPFLTLALDGGKWPASRPGCISPSTYWIGGWVGPRAGLNTIEKRKMSCPSRELTPAAQPIVCHYTD